MNKKFLLIFVLLCIFFTVGCGKKETSFEKHLISFSYSYGNRSEGLYDYSITLNNDKVIYISSSSDNPYIEKEIEKSILDEIDNIINENDILDWNGYDKYDDLDDEDKLSFSIQIGYDDGSNYNASGYGNYPKHFDKVHKEIITIFNKLNNQ